MPQLSGDEAFSIGGTVRDFWSYALSDLQSNAARGYLAEFLVARAVGATGARVEWDAFDLQAPDGTTIEVKTSGYTQTWAPRGPAVIVFSGLPGKRGKRSWYAATGAMGPAHVADVYVFAVQTAQRGDVYDGLDIDAWDFHVVPGRRVAETGQASMRLSTVVRIGGAPVAWHQLARAIRDAAAPVPQEAPG